MVDQNNPINPIDVSFSRPGRDCGTTGVDKIIKSEGRPVLQNRGAEAKDGFRNAAESLPGAEYISNHHICLLTHEKLGKDETSSIINTISKVLNNVR